MHCTIHTHVMDTNNLTDPRPRILSSAHSTATYQPRDSTNLI